VSPAHFTFFITSEARLTIVDLYLHTNAQYHQCGGAIVPMVLSSKLLLVVWFGTFLLLDRIISVLQPVDIQSGLVIHRIYLK